MISVCVLITTYNKQDYIATAIDSVLNQSKMPDEIVISDDSSEDDTLAIARQYLTYPNIKILKTPKNIGLPSNLNFAMDHIESTHVMQLDADDFYAPYKVEFESNLAKQFPNQIVYSDYVKFSEKNESVVSRYIRLEDLGNKEAFDVTNFFRFRKSFLPRDMLYPKEALLNLGGYDESLALYEDWDFKIRLDLDGWKFLYNPNCIGTFYRNTPGSLSKADWERHQLFRNRICQKNFLSDYSEPRRSLAIKLKERVTSFAYPVFRTDFMEAINFVKQYKA